MRTRGPLALCLALVASCSGDLVDGLPEELRPGDSLFDLLDQASVLAYPSTNLPAEVAAGLEAILDQPPVRIGPEAWRLDGPVAASHGLPEALRGGAPLRRWSLRPPFRLDLGLGLLTLRHRGTPVARLPERDAIYGSQKAGMRWLDETGRTLLWWNEKTGRLAAFSTSEPGALRIGYAASAGLRQGVYERRVPQGGDEEPAKLVRREAMGRSTRTCLLLPAAGVLEFPPRVLRGDELVVAVGLPAQSFTVVDGRLRREDGRGDGVTFVVEVKSGGVTRQAWSRHLGPGDGFVEARVDLGPWVGSSASLRLLSNPGPGGDPYFDQALWSGLRVEGKPARPLTLPHVILISIDTLRADRMGCYGNARPTTPRTDAWARVHATVYDDVVASGNWTLPSTASMLTGLTGPQHQVTLLGRPITTDISPLALLLREAGYETMAWTDGGFVAPTFGFDVGFDRFHHRQRSPNLDDDPGWDAALGWVGERRSERPFFLFLQTYMTHSPFASDRRFEDPVWPYNGSLAGQAVERHNVIGPVREGGLQLDADDREYVRRMYDASLVRMDTVLGRFLEGLERVLAGVGFLVIVTSDHGEELFEHGSIGHGHSVYGELVRVPFLVRFPSGRPVGRSGLAASTLDIVPTVLDMAELRLPAGLSGRSLRATAPGRRVRFVSGDPDLYAVYYDGWKLIRGGAGDEHPLPRLFQAGEDPFDLHDLALREPGLTRQLDGLLDAFLTSYPPRERSGELVVEPDAGTLRELQELGYLGGS